MGNNNSNVVSEEYIKPEKNKKSKSVHMFKDQYIFRNNKMQWLYLLE